MGNETLFTHIGAVIDVFQSKSHLNDEPEREQDLSKITLCQNKSQDLICSFVC